jgi:hypothetical protein
VCRIEDNNLVPVHPRYKARAHHHQLAFHVCYDTAATDIMAEHRKNGANCFAGTRRGAYKRMYRIWYEERKAIKNSKEDPLGLS